MHANATSPAWLGPRTHERATTTICFFRNEGCTLRAFCERHAPAPRARNFVLVFKTVKNQESEKEINQLNVKLNTRENRIGQASEDTSELRKDGSASDCAKSRRFFNF